MGDFIYVNNDAFTDKITYYSEAYITLEGADEFEAYSKEYDEFVEEKQKENNPDDFTYSKNVNGFRFTDGEFC